jgi:hypothetical protein
MRDLFRAATCSGLLMLGAPAEGSTSGVYHPYVNAGEREAEYGLTWRGVGDGAITYQRASFGHAWTDDISTEIYLLSESASHGRARTRAYELEIRWQLTEQGEYASDWGLLFEAEVDDDIDADEVAVGLLWEKELGGRWIGAANALLEYEYGGDVEDEFETGLRAQLRYRFAEALEPAIELYLDDEDYAVGPALQGAWRTNPGSRLRWDLGLFIGIDRKTPDASVRANLEFEF